MTISNPIPDQLVLGPPKDYQGLSVMPLYSEPVEGSVDYLTLDQALEQRLVRITEINEDGSVPELYFENRATKAVLLLDGEELIGAKQNRVLNLTILAPPEQTILIPVSCVEAGRWNAAKDEFTSSEQTQFAYGRARRADSVSRSMHESGDRRSNQGQVWGDIEMKFMRMNAASKTSAMADLYQKTKDRVESYVQVFKPLPDQSGAFFFVHGQPVGFDLFDQPETYSSLSRKLLRSYAIDAMEVPLTDSISVKPDRAEGFFMVLRQYDWRTYPGTGMGTDFRFSKASFGGSALVVKDISIHVSGFFKTWGQAG